MSLRTVGRCNEEFPLNVGLAGLDSGLLVLDFGISLFPHGTG